MDNQFPPDESSTKDVFEVSPESGPGEGAANFRAPRQEFLGGSSSPETVQSSPTEGSKQRDSLDREFVEVNGTRVSYIERGNPHGIPLMYIGGWASSVSGDKWFLDALEGKIPNSKGLRTLSENNPQSAEGVKRLVESLKDKYRIVDLELPGFGKSSPLEGEVNLDRMADFVPDFQKAIGLEKPVIFGSSMGGIVAVKLAARHPESVKALFLQGVMTQSSDMAKKPYKGGQFLGSWFVREIVRTPGLFSKVVTAGSKTDPDFKMSDKEAQAAMAEGFKLAHVKTATATVREIGKDIGEEIEKVQCPIVVVDGASGKTVSILNSANVAVRFHPEIQDPSEKIAQKKVIYLPMGGKAGEHGHTIVNTFPEGLATMIDNVLHILKLDQNPSA